ncbi:MAG: 3'(2'),5'-bisphosphate nucleotidase CysQ [Rhizobiales bacterium]|nr:3'(2'),5'-bisphosphate nucleotidase CysQ [Hyphomicrobiales bacterium]NRB14133.1 3'(2'),5'-bisphosphate nucleotidase CysQ [Hyphomicrobiales bacterium]
MNQYLQQLSALAIDAGRSIMKIYAQDFAVYTKQDLSPVTEADQLAEQIIVAGLQKLTPHIPIIAEEMAAEGRLPNLTGKLDQAFYLVDPLDGTKEFINKRDEFTVNIALIDQNKAIIGVVFAPALSLLYVADVAKNIAIMYKLNDDFNLAKPVSETDLTAKNSANKPYTILASRSHMNVATEQFIDQAKAQHAGLEVMHIGSSLKLCLLAQGVADIYPRFGPTMEWDIAAGHAILSAANGQLTTDTGDDFLYGDQNNQFRNGNFIAHAYKQI